MTVPQGCQRRPTVLVFGVILVQRPQPLVLLQDGSKPHGAESGRDKGRRYQTVVAFE